MTRIQSAQTHEPGASARTRAQVISDSVQIRLAVNDAGPGIAAVLKANGIELENADWNKVFPHWLIATVDDQIIGCCQVALSKPVGYLEFLFVKPETPFKLRAIAIRKLLIQGFATLSLAGCQYVGGIVAQNNRKFAGVLTKLNFAKTFPADVFVKRIA